MAKRPKSHSFSIYLLKKGFTAENSLQSGSGLKPISDASNIPEGAFLFVGDNPPTFPWWRNYFGITQDLKQSLKSALLFVPLRDRWFVLSFGHAYTKLDDNSYEYDFGLLVVLNSIDPEKLSSIDILEPGNGRRRRTQTPTPSDITLFDFDKDGSMLRNITGQVRDEYKEWFKNPSGASNLKISSPVTADGILELLQDLLETYNKKTYEGAFPNLLNLLPVKDPKQIAKLDEGLLAALKEEYDKEESEKLYLTIPEIVDHHQVDHICFKPKTKSKTFSDLYLERYYEHLEHIGKSLDEVALEDIQEQKIVLIGIDGKSEFKSFSLYKCLVFDIQFEDEEGVAYHLNEGQWCKVREDYLAKLRGYLDNFCETTSLPPYDHDNEGAYNDSLPSADSEFICLDGRNIAPDGEYAIEPCDLYKEDSSEALFIHVKRSTKSSSISHLLNQGVNSAEIIRLSDESLAKLHGLLQEKGRKNLPREKGDHFRVSFAIITHKDPSKKSENLPIFSQISLRRALESLERMGVAAQYEFVEDKRK